MTWSKEARTDRGWEKLGGGGKNVTKGINGTEEANEREVCYGYGTQQESGTIVSVSPSLMNGQTWSMVKLAEPATVRATKSSQSGRRTSLLANRPNLRKARSKPSTHNDQRPGRVMGFIQV